MCLLQMQAAAQKLGTDKVSEKNACAYTAAIMHSDFQVNGSGSGRAACYRAASVPAGLGGLAAGSAREPVTSGVPRSRLITCRRPSAHASAERSGSGPPRRQAGSHKECISQYDWLIHSLCDVTTCPPGRRGDICPSSRPGGREVQIRVQLSTCALKRGLRIACQKKGTYSAPSPILRSTLTSN